MVDGYREMNKVLSGIVKNVRGDIRRYGYAHDLARNAQHDDLYVVEFPKSGITWLSFIIANTIILKNKLDRSVNFYNVHDYVPDIHAACKNLSQDIKEFPGYRIIKSHSKFNPYYNKVIYLVRNPVDVMISYYNFRVQLGHYNGDFGGFIKSPMYGALCWCEHVHNWIEKTSETISYKLIKYEDLKANTVSTMSDLYDDLGLNVEREVIEQSVEMSSLEKMRTLEERFNYSSRPQFNKFQFVGEKKKGVRRSDIKQSDLDYLMDITKKFAYLGYHND